MIHKIYLSIIVFLAAVCSFFYFLAGYRGVKIERLQAKNTSINDKLTRCKNEMEVYFKASEQANKAICDIRTIVKTVKSPCDCYNSVVDPAIVARVRGK